MSTYFVAHITIHDPNEYDRYLARFDAVFEKYRGRVLAVDDAPTVLEGEWPTGRTVLMEFPDDGELRRWYDSPEYQEIAKHRRTASIAAIAMVSGKHPEP
jgi:uncharacterized protein (DUF1330 family)